MSSSSSYCTMLGIPGPYIIDKAPKKAKPFCYGYGGPTPHSTAICGYKHFIMEQKHDENEALDNEEYPVPYNSLCIDKQIATLKQCADQISYIIYDIINMLQLYKMNTSHMQAYREISKEIIATIEYIENHNDNIQQQKTSATSKRMMKEVDNMNLDDIKRRIHELATSIMQELQSTVARITQKHEIRMAHKNNTLHTLIMRDIVSLPKHVYQYAILPFTDDISPIQRLSDAEKKLCAFVTAQKHINKTDRNILLQLISEVQWQPPCSFVVEILSDEIECYGKPTLAIIEQFIVFANLLVDNMSRVKTIEKKMEEMRNRLSIGFKRMRGDHVNLDQVPDCRYQEENGIRFELQVLVRFMTKLANNGEFGTFTSVMMEGLEEWQQRTEKAREAVLLLHDWFYWGFFIAKAYIYAQWVHICSEENSQYILRFIRYIDQEQEENDRNITKRAKHSN